MRDVIRVAIRPMREVIVEAIRPMREVIREAIRPMREVIKDVIRVVISGAAWPSPAAPTPPHRRRARSEHRGCPRSQKGYRSE